MMMMMMVQDGEKVNLTQVIVMQSEESSTLMSQLEAKMASKMGRGNKVAQE